MSKERPEAKRDLKLTAAQEQAIRRLFDKPATPAEIAKEVGVSVSAVRQVLVSMTPWM
jgi:DNA invertase Pin-like site-specific DNA recombinase